MNTIDSGFKQRFGPWAIVTGASDGIGRAFARELAAAGLNLVLVARREPALNALAESLRTQSSVECLVLPVDLADRKSVELVARATAELDIGLMVAAAGFGTSGPLVHGNLETECDMVAVNCTATMALSWHFARRLADRGRGGLVLMSSLLAFHGVPRAANYAATKAYVQSLAEGLRVELAPMGVDVIASAPGPIRSGFADRADMRMSMSEAPEVVARGTLKALGRRTTVRPGWLSKLLGWSLAPLPRWGQVKIITQVMGGMTSHQTAARFAAERPQR